MDGNGPDPGGGSFGTIRGARYSSLYFNGPGGSLMNDYADDAARLSACQAACEALLGTPSQQCVSVSFKENGACAGATPDNTFPSCLMEFTSTAAKNAALAALGTTTASNAGDDSGVGGTAGGKGSTTCAGCGNDA